MKSKSLVCFAVLVMFGIGELFIFSGCRKDKEVPKLTTAAITNITINSAFSGGNVTSDGGADVTGRGLCWSTSQNSSVSDAHTTDGTGTGNFVSSLSGLSPNTLYYVRAYATNSVGTAYGNEVSFTTNPIVAATLTTNVITLITPSSAVSGGDITANGGGEISSRGVCWATTTGPTINDSKTSDDSGNGKFTSNITGLKENTKYYVRAYAVNTAGTAYGNEVSFTTSLIVIPTIATSSVSTITSSSAIAGGNVTNDGGGSVTDRGVCWATTANPTVSNSKTTDGAGTGIYSSALTGLLPGTTYHIRAYATNSAGTAYGSDMSFATAAGLPSLTTVNVSGITQTTANSGGNISSNGGAAITAKGVCWGISAGPTVEDSYTNNGTGSSNFTSSLTGLTPSTKYYVRAYATNSTGTAYGNEVSFNSGAVALAIVSTTSVTSVMLNTASSGGNITSAGGGTISARGVCWGTSSSPTISGSHTSDNTGTGSFTSNMTGLSEGTVYYARAYATNYAGTAYGAQVIFSTSISDVDGNTYPTVIIGTQVWMASNLKTTKFNTNATIDMVTDTAAWMARTTPAYCWFDNDENTYKPLFGALYNWYAASTSALCPIGWHVPTDTEFKTLEIYLGMTQSQADGTLWRGTDQGTELKSSTSWNPNTGTNLSGFNASGGGYRMGKLLAQYCDFGKISYWWSSSEHWDNTKGLYRRLDGDNAMVFREGVKKSGGKYIRCLKN